MMKLDRTFENEIRKTANGDGGREYRFDLLRQLKEISTALADWREFDSCLQKYGRVKVALCVASTIYKYKYRFDSFPYSWATLVLALWTNKYTCSVVVSEAIINIHPAHLQDVSGSMMRLSMED
jgi:hypothetical protein